MYFERIEAAAEPMTPQTVSRTAEKPLDRKEAMNTKRQH